MRLPALGIVFCAVTAVTSVAACSTEVAAHSAPAVAQVVRPPAKGDVADPVRLRAPAIGVSTRVIGLKLDARNRLIAPTGFDRVGWNKAGPEPGEAGASVIAGHVDSKSGPAVFHRLKDLRPGHRIHIDRADGSVVTFTVRRLARFPKNRVPGEEVYGSAKGAELRLITCGGTFDHKRRSYRDNVVVFAS